MERTTKAQRRNFAKLVRETAEQCAARCWNYGDDGTREPVAHPKARGALVRAFARMFEDGGVCKVLKLSRREALAFPGQEACDLPDHASPWLAVGMDASNHPTYSLRWLGLSFGDQLTDRAVAEAMMLSELYQQIRFSGLPPSNRA